MRFSFWTGNSHPWAEILDACSHAEATGWDGLWIADHFMPLAGPPDGPVHEAWSVLAALAAAVPRVRLGPLVCGNTYRNPALLAKIAASVDQISGGRLVVGLGAGWQENEHLAYGFEYGTVKTRSERLEEAAAIVRSLLRNQTTSLSGAYYTVIDAPLEPKPANPDIPLLIGGGGEQRTLRTAARYADEWNVWGTPELLAAKMEVLDARCAEVDRDPGEIARSAVALLVPGELPEGNDFLASRPTISGSVEQMVDTVGRYVQVGVDELVIPDFTLGSLDRRKDTLDMFMNEVVSAVR
ncbi:MAG: TIGR03560 family F420-dependent LLM class oxidoreductase [Acidimicrobiales bacterium]|nr:TIGR03560 family F420-dependent LLM class oxidoreductase [Acidimicrobiales bacterium]